MLLGMENDAFRNVGQITNDLVERIRDIRRDAFAEHRVGEFEKPVQQGPEPNGVKPPAPPAANRGRTPSDQDSARLRPPRGVEGVK
jgi:hypothetical protein